MGEVTSGALYGVFAPLREAKKRKKNRLREDNGVNKGVDATQTVFPMDSE